MNIPHNIKASFHARIIEPLTVARFDLTRWGKALAGYKNKYAGRRCFFIGNGPSLCAEDLTRLQKKGEICFAFNRIYNIFDQTPWRPTFYISQDEKMLGGCADTVNQAELGIKLIPIQLKWYHGIQIQNATWFNIIHQQAESPMDFLFSDDAARELYNSSTVMYTAAQLAAYMGFSEIILIGVDHHFRFSQNNQGEIVVDESAKDYFSEKYNEDKANLYIPNTEKSTLTYMAMKTHCDTRGIRVYNATRGGRLEVFQRIDFEEILK